MFRFEVLDPIFILVLPEAKELKAFRPTLVDSNFCQGGQRLQGLQTCDLKKGTVIIVSEDTYATFNA